MVLISGVQTGTASRIMAQTPEVEEYDSDSKKIKKRRARDYSVDKLRISPWRRLVTRVKKWNARRID
ncbi:MAG: hypothetical protein GVY19_11870, partial [Bacteroidetes bacterium]|nr:hypothetical protein [Bacteroidota bacterium]